MTLSELRAQCQGSVTTADDESFGAALHDGLWNRLRPGRAPQLVVRVANERDVSAAIRFARANGLKVAVRGGGHNWCQPTLRHGGVLVDLSDLNQIVSVDVAARRAVVQPIVSNRDVQRALNPLGLAFPTGHCPQVKVSGYLLGGGMAWNPTVWGSGAENVEAIELVDARGEWLRASATENADYFWAARGAGSGFFGVVTRYHLRCHPLPRAIHGSTLYFPLAAAPEVGEWLGQLAPKLSPSVELSQFIVQAPPEMREVTAADNGWLCMVTGGAFEDTADAAIAALQPLENGPIAPMARAAVTPLTFEQLFDASGALWPEGVRARVEAMFSNACPGAMMRDIVPLLRATPSPTTVFLFTIFCGPNVPARHGDTALSMSGRVYGGPWTMWWDADDDAANAAWHRELTEALRRFNVGAYIGESNTVERPANAVEAFSADNWQRLADLRAQCDPDGVFFGYFDGFEPAQP